VSAGRLGSSAGRAWAQFSPESGSVGAGLEGPEDAQAAESTSDETVRMRPPSFFFMATPLESNPVYPWFEEEYTAAPGWIEDGRLLKKWFRFSGHAGCWHSLQGSISSVAQLQGGGR
jgi:hypothetical protein